MFCSFKMHVWVNVSRDNKMLMIKSCTLLTWNGFLLETSLCEDVGTANLSVWPA